MDERVNVVHRPDARPRHAGRASPYGEAVGEAKVLEDDRVADLLRPAVGRERDVPREGDNEDEKPPTRK